MFTALTHKRTTKICFEKSAKYGARFWIDASLSLYSRMSFCTERHAMNDPESARRRRYYRRRTRRRVTSDGRTYRQTRHSRTVCNGRWTKSGVRNICPSETLLLTAQLAQYFSRISCTRLLITETVKRDYLLHPASENSQIWKRAGWQLGRDCKVCISDAKFYRESTMLNYMYTR